MRIGGVEIMQYASGMMSSSSSAVEALNLKEASNWWSDVDESPVWQDRIFHVLAILYGIVSVVAVNTIQSSRIWLDYAKGLPLSQFRCEWRLVLSDSFLSQTTARVKAFGQPWKPASTSPQFEKSVILVGHSTGGFMFEKPHMKGLYFNQSPNKVHTAWSNSGILRRIMKKKRVFREPRRNTEVEAVLRDYKEHIFLIMSFTL